MFTEGRLNGDWLVCGRGCQETCPHPHYRGFPGQPPSLLSLSLQHISLYISRSTTGPSLEDFLRIQPPSKANQPVYVCLVGSREIVFICTHTLSWICSPVPNPIKAADYVRPSKNCISVGAPAAGFLPFNGKYYLFRGITSVNKNDSLYRTHQYNFTCRSFAATAS